MRAGLLMKRFKDETGMSIVMVMVVLVVIGLASITIMNFGDQKKKMSDQISVSVSADIVRQKLVGAILAPAAWQKTQAKNSAAFASFDPNHPPKLDIYTPDSNTPFYRTTDGSAGFDLKGSPCTGFIAASSSSSQGGSTQEQVAGNDACPFRYEVTLKNRTFQNGNWIDTLHLALKFHPASTSLILNAGSPLYTFDLVRNMNNESVESACISISGVYDPSSNACSVKLTKPVATCPNGRTYRGPGANSSATNCDVAKPPAAACTTGKVVKGFDSNGNPVCGAPL